MSNHQPLLLIDQSIAGTTGCTSWDSHNGMKVELLRLLRAMSIARILQGNGSTDDGTNCAHVADYRHEFLRDPFLTYVPRQFQRVRLCIGRG